MTVMGDEQKPRVKRVRLTGTRFNGGRLPIDSLEELQKYQEIVRIAAEAEWRDGHPGEQLPADFEESVSLTIDHIDEGSADVFLAFEQQQSYVEYQAEAQEVTDAIIAAAYSGEDLPELPSLPLAEDFQFRQVIASIGESLKSEQAIEFYLDGPASSPVTITAETREHAAERIFNVDDFLVSPEAISPAQSLVKSDESLVGRVTALDADKKRFTLVLSSGHEVHGRYREHPELLEDLRKVVNSTSDGPLTRIAGELQTKNGEAWRFWETHSVEQVEFDDTAWGVRLQELAALPTGWDGGDAAQITSSSLDASQKLLQAVDRAQIDPPGVFPTEEGGVLIEWASLSAVSSVEILADGSFELFSMKRDELQGEHAATADLMIAIEFVEARNE